MAGRGAQIVLGLIIGILLTRYLGPDRYGIYSYALSFAMLFAPLANLGLAQIVVREVVNEKEREEAIMGTASGIRLVGTGFAFSAIALAAIWLVDEQQTRWAIAIASSAVLLRTPQLLIAWFQAKVQSKYSAIPHLVTLSLSSLTKVILILKGAGLMAFVWVVAVDALLYSLSLMIGYRRLGHRISSWTFDPELARRLLSRSWPLMFSLIVFTIYMQIDQVMIKFFMGYEQVGWYAAAVRLSTAAYAVPAVIAASLFPAILNSLNRDRAQFRRRMLRLYYLLIYLSLFIILPLALLSGFIVEALFGTNFLPAADVLSIHVVASLFVFIGYAGDKWLIGEDLQLASFKAMIAGLIANIGLNAILIPQIGIQGAAWATLGAQAVGFHFIHILFPESRKVFLLQSRALLECAVGIPIIRFLRGGASFDQSAGTKQEQD